MLWLPFQTSPSINSKTIIKINILLRLLKNCCAQKQHFLLSLGFKVLLKATFTRTYTCWAHVKKNRCVVHLGLSMSSHVHLHFLARVLLGQLMSNMKSSQELNLLPTTSRQSRSGHKARTQTKCLAVTAPPCAGGLPVISLRPSMLIDMVTLGAWSEAHLGRIQIKAGYFNSAIITAQSLASNDHQHKVAAPISVIFWLTFCTAWGRRDASSSFIYSLCCRQGFCCSKAPSLSAAFR